MILHLSLERINSGETPYQVEPTEQNGFYQFFTDGGVHYSVGFVIPQFIPIDHCQYQQSQISP